jgi:integrase
MRFVRSGVEASHPLPDKVVTREGYVFDPRHAVWAIGSLQSRSSLFDFDLKELVESNLIDLLKLTLIDVIEKQSFSHCNNLWGRFTEFYRSVIADRGPIDHIRLDHLMNYRASLTNATVWKLGHVRVLIERGERLGYPIATPDALAYLKDAVISGNPKGNDVRTLDPEKGPFTTIELESLNAALNDGYVQGLVSLPKFAICHLMLAFGMRAKQIAAMKECDLVIAGADDGSEVFSLRIPRAKQHGELDRGSFRVRPCDGRLGVLLKQLLAYNARVKVASAKACTDWPLLIHKQIGDVPGFEYHHSAREIGIAILQTFELVSPLHANSKRFRHTLAKRAHDDGADIYVIAELLDHSDIQNAAVYTEGSPDIIDRLNRTMAMELAPVAQAFAGLLITRQDIDARRAGPAKRIHDRALPGGKGADPLGNCGMHGFCGLARPIACYTCRNFRPWVDGPHSEVLDVLIADRDAQRQKGYAPRIFGLHDRTITAVARVVQLCEERQGGDLGASA